VKAFSMDNIQGNSHMSLSVEQKGRQKREQQVVGMAARFLALQGPALGQSSSAWPPVITKLK
jgi:hypothetical protein